MKFAELKVGMKSKMSKTFTAADVTMFAGISCDINPIHISDSYAAGTMFTKRIVHGVLVTGLISAVLANKLPGEGSIYLGQDTRFVSPVFINDDITAEVEIIELREDKKIVKLSTTCYKVDGTQVITGTAIIKLSE